MNTASKPVGGCSINIQSFWATRLNGRQVVASTPRPPLSCKSTAEAGPAIAIFGTHIVPSVVSLDEALLISPMPGAISALTGSCS